jgi:phosphoenolpyruvate phosphomutase
MIHSKRNDASEILQFAKQFRIEFPQVPLVAVPSTFGSISLPELDKAGFNIVIYANHLLRSAYPAMKSAATKLLIYQRAEEVEEELISLPEFFKLIPTR